MAVTLDDSRIRVILDSRSRNGFYHSRSEALAMNDLMTIEEAAEFLRATPASLRFWRYQGTGPRSAKLGRRVYYRRTELAQWVEDRFNAETAVR